MSDADRAHDGTDPVELLELELVGEADPAQLPQEVRAPG